MVWDGTLAHRLACLLLPAFLLAGVDEAPAIGLAKRPTYTPSGEWEGFFRNDKGVAAPILQPIEQNKDKDWMDLQFTEYGGPRIRLAVMGVENKTATAEQANTTDAVAVNKELAEVPVSSLEEILTTAVMSTNRFEVVERKAIEGVLSEQDLGASGRAKPGTAAKTGRILGAEYLLLASVNEWTPDKGKVGGAGGGLGSALGLIGAQKSTAEVAMSFRIVDASTSQVLFSITERATTGSWGIGLGGADDGAGAVVGYKKKSPIGYAVQACINKGIYQIALWIKDRPWSGQVVQVDGSKVFINAGSNSGISTGMVLNALAKGKELVDPVTRSSLGFRVEKIGTLQVAEVQERYAVANITEGCKGLKAGDRVELQRN